MIVHVLDRAREAKIGPVAVACGDAEIAAAVRATGGVAVLTDPTLPRGSDRVHAALAELDPQGHHDVVVNLQGDLPTIPPSYLRTVLAPLSDPAFDIATLVAPIDTEEEANLPSVVKAACAFDRGRAVSPALYFSRVPIPWGRRPALAPHRYLRILPHRACAPSYRYQKHRWNDARAWEQLRALEAGMRIACARVDHAPFGVDTPGDLERARKDLAPKGSSA